MTTYQQLVFLLYGVISRCHSLSNLCKSLLFLDNKLSYLGISNMPTTSTLRDANIIYFSIPKYLFGLVSAICLNKAEPKRLRILIAIFRSCDFMRSII